MLPFEDRFTRQRQLREVGLSGQKRISESHVVLGRGAADGVAADYLQRAGVNVQVADGRPFGETVSTTEQARALCAFDGPADYLVGTLAALGHLRLVLGLGSSSAPGIQSSANSTRNDEATKP